LVVGRFPDIMFNTTHNLAGPYVVHHSRIEMSNLDADFTSPTVPAFLTKLRLLVDDGETNDLIYWDQVKIPSSLFTFVTVIVWPKKFSRCSSNTITCPVLSDNLIYGFRKVNRVDPNVGMKTELEDMEFKHPYFVRSKPHLMSKIQRKPHVSIPGSFIFNGRNANMSVPSYLGGVGMGAPTFTGLNHPSHAATVADVERLYTMIRGLRSNQETMNNQLTLVQSENQLLYRELAELRERHEQQSQLIQTVGLSLVRGTLSNHLLSLSFLCSCSLSFQHLPKTENPPIFGLDRANEERSLLPPRTFSVPNHIRGLS
uniref:HSF_DOMAIN domain-containing protein n=1 Tax=Echinostoma caproni TaxID=27848 RepID=A0A183B7Z5_9TREM